MHRYSLTLTQVIDAGGDRLGITPFLQTIGKTEADGSFAAAFDPTNTLAEASTPSRSRAPMLPRC